MMPYSRLAILLAALGSTAAVAAPDCCSAPGADYPKVGGNYGNQSYSALGQITPANAARLGGAWHVRLEGGSDSAFQQGNVIAEGGIVYAETTQGSVVAVDGATGTEKWHYKSSYGSTLRRGVAVGDNMVFTIKGAGHVIALDKQTGTVVWDVTPTADRGAGSFPTAIVYYDGLIYFGSANGTRGAAFALDAKTGKTVWTVYGAAGPDDPEANKTWDGESWRGGGAAPWAHPAIDPELGLLYWTFGNARGGTPLDGATRAGQNLYANSIVAMDLKTGAKRWYYQSVHHDIWDMDNVMAPVLADLTIGGKARKAVIYGSKTAMLYVLDRETGKPLTPIDEKPVPQEPEQHTWPTQPFPRGDSLVDLCPTGKGASITPPHYKTGCIFTPHLDDPVIVFPGTGGGADTSAYSYSQKSKLLYVGVGIVGIAQARKGSYIGFRPLGENRSGKVIAYDPARHKIVWSRDNQWSLAHGNGILSTSSGVLFMGYPDGFIVALSAADGRELWRFQTGAGVHTSPVAYEAGGQQYVAVLAGGNGLPYNSPKGDHLWAFKIGGTVAPADPPPPPPHRQPITAKEVEGSTIGNTVILGRIGNGSATPPSGEGPPDAGFMPGGARSRPTTGANGESDAQNAMSPQALRVPAGTTVTFTNPSDNLKDHCATQFFEGLFDSKPLKPGQSFKYTFRKKGEYFYNDCANAGTTGKVVVY
ncbi:MAG: dehydrogenase [Sphingomonas sp.]|nr:MAG: dehydrogenase [Sphingomonas sp.]